MVHLTVSEYWFTFDFGLVEGTTNQWTSNNGYNVTVEQGSGTYPFAMYLPQDLTAECAAMHINFNNAYRYHAIDVPDNIELTVLCRHT